MAALALLFFAALSLNLILIFALGIRELVLRERVSIVSVYYPWFILFVSTSLLWVLFARILIFTGGIFNYFLMLPLAILTGFALEKLFFFTINELKKNPRYKELLFDTVDNPGMFSIGSSYSGMSAAALFLTLHFALSFADAVLLSLAFSAGGLLAFLILKEIQKRSFLEVIPYGLRGTPILLISAGLLSLIFSAASVLFIKMLI